MRTLGEDKFSKVKLGIGSRQKDEPSEPSAPDSNKANAELLSKIAEVVSAIKESIKAIPEQRVIVRDLPAKQIDSSAKDMLLSLQAIEKQLIKQSEATSKENEKIAEMFSQMNNGEKKNWKVVITKRDSHGLIESFDINQK